ncbi:hypothetical protein BDQ12DRAFT_764475 [Crucibulum laeve]|uniref:Uncharacterized protein n=1 Tax=Crucibulum laeve TaxID=68775 RepID=A0A5C3LMP9_9AGAR|nr:hypothetical protein BDQ12DRAFT_764475 [Crucibulum laeve]
MYMVPGMLGISEGMYSRAFNGYHVPFRKANNLITINYVQTLSAYTPFENDDSFFVITVGEARHYPRDFEETLFKSPHSAGTTGSGVLDHTQGFSDLSISSPNFSPTNKHELQYKLGSQEKPGLYCSTDECSDSEEVTELPGNNMHLCGTLKEQGIRAQVKNATNVIYVVQRHSIPYEAELFLYTKKLAMAISLAQGATPWVDHQK